MVLNEENCAATVVPEAGVKVREVAWDAPEGWIMSAVILQSITLEMNFKVRRKRQGDFVV